MGPPWRVGQRGTLNMTLKRCGAREVPCHYISPYLYILMSYERILHALADATRRDILARLRQRPHTVGEVAAQLPVSQPAVSQHLKVLRDAGLVSVEKDGVRRIHHLRVDGLEPLRLYVASFWGEALEAFGRSFETEPRQRGTE